MDHPLAAVCGRGPRTGRSAAGRPYCHRQWAGNRRSRVVVTTDGALLAGELNVGSMGCFRGRISFVKRKYKTVN